MIRAAVTLPVEEIETKIDRALAQFERGEFFTAEESRADMERRKAAWMSEEGARVTDPSTSSGV